MHAFPALLLVSLLLLQGLLNPAQGQDFRAGLILGGASAQLSESGMSAPERSRRQGIVAGLSLGLRLSPYWMVQAEIQHVDRGARGENGFEFHSRYLDFPLYVRGVFLSPESRIRPTLVFGTAPALEYRCSAVGPLNLPGAPPPEVISLSCSEIRTWRMDFSLMMGGGVEISSARSTVRFEGRYNHGLMDLTKGNDTSLLQNRTFAGMLSFEVPIGN